MSPLRDFLYLDRAKLHSFVSQIQGGMISEISETIKQLGGISAGLNVGIPPLGGKIDASKGKESERQQIIELTDPAYFGVLHEYLRLEKELFEITEIRDEEMKKIETGQFIEIQGLAEPPSVENWIARVNSIFGFMERNLRTVSKLQTKKSSASTISNMQLRQFKAIIDLLTDYVNISQKDPGKQYIRIKSEYHSFKVWCGLLPEYSLVSLNAALPTIAWVFGRVERKLSEGEVYKIVDLSLFNQASNVTKLLDALNSFNSVTGQPQISETDLEAYYPDLFVAPVAIYK
jgi:hypothetical protein